MVISYRFPRSHVELWARYILVTFLTGCPFWSHLLQTLTIVHHRGDSTGDDLLAFYLSALLTPFAAVLATRAPLTLHPHRWTRVHITGLCVSWFHLWIAEALIRRLTVPSSNAGYTSRLITFDGKLFEVIKLRTYNCYVINSNDSNIVVFFKIKWRERLTCNFDDRPVGRLI